MTIKEPYLEVEFSVDNTAVDLPIELNICSGVSVLRREKSSEEIKQIIGRHLREGGFEDRECKSIRVYKMIEIEDDEKQQIPLGTKICAVADKFWSLGRIAYELFQAKDAYRSKSRLHDAIYYQQIEIEELQYEVRKTQEKISKLSEAKHAERDIEEENGRLVKLCDHQHMQISHLKQKIELLLRHIDSTETSRRRGPEDSRNSSVNKSQSSRTSLHLRTTQSTANKVVRGKRCANPVTPVSMTPVKCDINQFSVSASAVPNVEFPVLSKSTSEFLESTGETSQSDQLPSKPNISQARLAQPPRPIIRTKGRTDLNRCSNSNSAPFIHSVYKKNLRKDID